jgi:hypothetical protein
MLCMCCKFIADIKWLHTTASLLLRNRPFTRPPSTAVLSSLKTQLDEANLVQNFFSSIVLLEENICKQEAEQTQDRDNLKWYALALLDSISNVVDGCIVCLALCHLSQS